VHGTGFAGTDARALFIQPRGFNAETHDAKLLREIVRYRNADLVQQLAQRSDGGHSGHHAGMQPIVIDLAKYRYGRIENTLLGNGVVGSERKEFKPAHGTSKMGFYAIWQSTFRPVQHRPIGASLDIGHGLQVAQASCSGRRDPAARSFDLDGNRGRVSYARNDIEFESGTGYARRWRSVKVIGDLPPDGMLVEARRIEFDDEDEDDQD
jgi:hypothetical protein